VEFHFVNIPLIYREDLAGLRPAAAVKKTTPLFFQQGASQQQGTTDAALTAGPLTNGELSMDIPFLKMDQQKAPQFPVCMKHKARTAKPLYHSENPTIKRIGQSAGLTKPSV